MVFKIMHDKAPSHLTGQNLCNLMSQGIAGYDIQNKDFYKRNTLNINGDKEVFRSQHQNYRITFQNL